jgi:flagellar motor switch/type III secretory pathway protein FliN
MGDVFPNARAMHVEVNVILCRMCFTFGEIATLAVGDVVKAELEDPSAGVEISVNGTTVARGRLVIRDDIRFVEVTEIPERPLRGAAPVNWSLLKAE